MAFEKVKNFFVGNDEKYEILYYKYSKLKLENQHLKEMTSIEIKKNNLEAHKKIANELISLYSVVEIAKNDSFKVKALDKDLQKFLLDVNMIEKRIKEIMLKYSIEQVIAQERFYDPQIHDIASYESANGMAKGIILKTARKGFRYKNLIIQKPKVVVTK